LLPLFGTMDKFTWTNYSLKVALARKSQFPKKTTEIARKMVKFSL
jgi:hypothetical protein